MRVIAAILGLSVLASAANAQQHKKARAGVSRPPQFAIDGALGFAVPVGSFGDAVNTGIDLMGAFEVWPDETMPVGFRGEIGYSNFGFNGGGGSATSLRFIADAEWQVPMVASNWEPYFLGGLGLYSITATASTSTFAFGFNLGGGIRYRIGAIAPFFELRYQIPLSGPGGLSSAQFFPFQFGVRYAIPR